MDNNAICHKCGRTVDASFVYCPWCGTVAEELETLGFQIDSVFSGITGMNDGSRIARMKDALGVLEQELSLLIPEARSS